MLSYLSKSAGIGGAIKAAPQDFLVEEIAPDGTIYELGRPFSRQDEEGGYVHFILQKRNWSTSSAIMEIGNNLRAGPKDFNFAGSKDKAAITTQAVSVRGLRKDALLNLRIKDISINGAWSAKDRLRLGDLLGNRFTIKVRDAHDDLASRSEAVASELGGKMPNYFGEQRFGSSRRNTHLIGRKLLEGELEDALIMFLCDTSNERNQDVSAARTELENGRDFGAALKAFPRHLRLERTVISYLA